MHARRGIPGLGVRSYLGLRNNPSRGETRRYYKATPLGENITVYVPRINPSRGEHYHIFSTGQPLMGRKTWQVFNGTTSLRGYSSDAVFSEQPSLGGISSWVTP